jgi:hypothetical protein
MAVVGDAEGFRGESGVAERGDKVGVQLRCAMRRDHDAFLFGVMGDAERLGETAVAGGVELDVADRARIDEIADGEAVEFTFGVRQWNGDGVCEAAEVGWLQVPE